MLRPRWAKRELEKPERAGVTVLHSNGFLHIHAVGDIGLFEVVVRVIHPPRSFGIQVYERAGDKITHNAKAEHPFMTQFLFVPGTRRR